MDNSKRAILTTLLYSDIFSFPLTQDELWRYLIAEEKISRATFLASFLKLKTHVSKEGKYFTLRGREEIVATRITREREAVTKQRIARQIAGLLSHIPTIMFIGISGSLATGNVEKEDDIDLFLIARRRTLWTTRLFVLLFLTVTKKRRKHNLKSAPNKICVNFLLSDDALSLSQNRQDVYTAREIAQLFPLFDRNNTYYLFLYANQWISHFLPNVTPHRELKNAVIKRQKKYLSIFFERIEVVSKAIQLFFITKKKTREEVNDSLMAFHPYDYRATILKTFSQKKKAYNL